jgi:glycosyltransferase involved in cell wall biosynthesis
LLFRIPSEPGLDAAPLDEPAGVAFDPKAYGALYPDVPRDPDLARAHYVLHGEREGRYVSPEALAADCVLLRDSGLFDEAAYRAAAGLGPGGDAVRHYLLEGWRRGIDPGPGLEGAFLAPYYATAGYFGPPAITFLVLRAAGWPVFANRAEADHFAESIRLSPLFDAHGYRAQLAEEGLDPVLHYLLVGEKTGLVPSGRFDPVYYGERYPDVVEARLNLLWHYLARGISENRRPLPVAADMVTPFTPAAGKEVIVLVSHDASRTGAPILALNLGRRLRDRFSLVTILLRGGDLVPEFAEISDHLVPLHDAYRHEVEFRYIIRALQKIAPIRYALVNSIESRDILPALTTTFVPTVLVIHEFAAYTRPRGAMREALGWATELVFPAQVVADSALREHPALRERRFHVVPQGSCELPVSRRPTDLGRERRRLEAAMRPPGSGDTFVVLGAGGFHIRKGIDLFLTTAAAARRLSPERSFRFVWIGHGFDPDKDVAYSVYLAEQIARSGLSETVVLLDEVTDLAPAYALADTFYLSSRLDPLPNVTIDSALRGLPIVCFEGATGMADVLGRDATAARAVVPHLDAHAAARAIIDLANDEALRAQVGEATRALGESLFRMERYIVDLDAIGEEAVESMRRRCADFATISDDPLFDEGLFLQPHSPIATRDGAIGRFLAYWSATRTSAKPLDHLPAFRRPCPGFHPQIYAQHNPDVLRADVNPFADYIRRGRPEGPWVHRVFQAEMSEPRGSRGTRLRCAIQAHFFYPELIHDFLDKLAVNAASCDLLLSTSTQEKAQALRAATRGFRRGRVDIRVVPNRGRDIGPLLTAFRAEIAAYDVVGHIHSKRTLGIDNRLGETWREFLWQNLIGGLYPMMDFALERFAEDEGLGLLFPEEPHLVDWNENYPIAETLAARAGIATPLPPFFEFPVGTMFWARPQALAPLVGLNLGWEDYPEEPIDDDCTVLHAIERLLCFSARHAGLDFATTYIPGVNR